MCWHPAEWPRFAAIKVVPQTFPSVLVSPQGEVGRAFFCGENGPLSQTTPTGGSPFPWAEFKERPRKTFFGEEEDYEKADRAVSCRPDDPGPGGLLLDRKSVV